MQVGADDIEKLKEQHTNEIAGLKTTMSSMAQVKRQIIKKCFSPVSPVSTSTHLALCLYRFSCELESLLVLQEFLMAHSCSCWIPAFAFCGLQFMHYVSLVRVAFE